ncbi:MAG: sensor histidine kinase [Myxococcales bacterium]
MKLRSTTYAAGLAGFYVAIAGGWIVFSSASAARFATSVEQLHRFERFKGVGFVLATGLALFFGARTLFSRIERSAADLMLRERALLSNERRIFAGLMASSVAHDANNVLVGVLGDLDELATKPEQSAGTRQHLETSVGRLVALNKRLLEAGRQTTTASAGPLELTEAVREAADLVRHHPALRYTRLTVVDGTPMVVHAHPMLITQIVTNLLVNAGEATSGRGKVEISSRRDGSRALLEVRDDGPGVPEGRRAGLFEALQSTKPDGNGMGLFSVKACARALGGTVEILDAPGGGACFRVSLPLDDKSGA